MDRKFMDLALIRARRAGEDGEVPVGAVVVRDGKVIGTGRNRREKTHNALAHAEIEAINAACAETGDWRLDDCELYVTLEPCPMCAGAIINSRINRLIFGAFDYRAGACGSVINLFEQNFNHKPSVTAGLMETQCKNELTKFFKKLREKRI